MDNMNNTNQNDNNQLRAHHQKMSDIHLKQKSAFKKLFDSGIQIDYKDPKIIRMICNGVPSIFRAKVWPALIQNVHGITSRFYQTLILKANSYFSAEQNDLVPERVKIINQLNKIEHDIQRTYPELKIFRKDSEMGQSLFNILSAWIVFRQDVGYIQGMSQIAGLLLLQLKQIQAFSLFCSILTTDVIFFYQNMDIQDIQFFEHTFDKRLKRGDQLFFLKIKQLGIETRTYLFGWILTLFTRTMSLDMISQTWDILFAYGLSQDILIQVSFHLIMVLKKRLNQQFQSSQFLGQVKNFKLTDVEAYSIICSIRQFYHCLFYKFVLKQQQLEKQIILQYLQTNKLLPYINFIFLL